VVITAHYSPSYSPQNCGFVKEREKENILPEFGEGEESAVHSFPLKSLFLLYSQVLWEAGAEAGVPRSDLDVVDRKTDLDLVKYSRL